MNDDEINQACAEELGYTNISIVCWRGHLNGIETRIPYFPTDANATLTLIEYLKKAGWRVSLSTETEGVYCCAANAGVPVLVQVIYDTFQRAVCIAFLKAVGRYRE